MPSRIALGVRAEVAAGQAALGHDDQQVRVLDAEGRSRSPAAWRSRAGRPKQVGVGAEVAAGLDQRDLHRIALGLDLAQQPLERLGLGLAGRREVGQVGVLEQQDVAGRIAVGVGRGARHASAAPPRRESRAVARRAFTSRGA